MARICVDAGFLIGLYDPRDQHHEIAIWQYENFFGPGSPRNQMAIAWPVLYECLGSRYAKDVRKSQLLREKWNYLQTSAQLWLLDDSAVREQCLNGLMEVEASSRPLSLVDRLLRAMIESRKRSFDCLLTYNTGDFADACERSGILLINEHTIPKSYEI